MKTGIQETYREYKELVEATTAFWDAAGDEPLTDAQKTEVKDRNKRIEELEHAIADAQENEGMRVKNRERAAALNEPVNRLEMGGETKASKRNGRGEFKTIGEMVMEDRTFAEWMSSTAPNGRVITSKFGNSPNVQLKTLITGDSSTSAGAFVQTLFRGLQDSGAYQRELTIMDLISVIPVSTDAISYVREGTPTNNAAPVAEASATSGATGSKPESAMVYSVVNDTVKTIAHWIPATRRALADVPQMRAMINQFLTYGLREEVEDQIIDGDGTGENLTGIANTSGIQSQAWTTDRLVTTRKARTKVRTVGKTRPTAFAMHPNDWEAFDLETDGEERYYFGGPSEIGNPRLWGLPVVESEGLTEGEGYIANWRYAVMYDRQDVQIYTSDSHSDFFTRNLIAILAELRCGFGLIRPAAFVEIDLTA